MSKGNSLKDAPDPYGRSGDNRAAQQVMPPDRPRLWRGGRLSPSVGLLLSTLSIKREATGSVLRSRIRHASSSSLKGNGIKLSPWIIARLGTGG